MRSRLVVSGWAAVLLCLAGCETAPGPTTGALRITAATTGGDPDLNGYIVQLDGANQGTVPANGVLVIRDLATGSHAIALADVAPNCVLVGVVSLTVGIRAGDTSRVTMSVACVATGIRVTTTTTGLDRDGDGYGIAIDGVPAGTVGINNSADVTRLATGDHLVTLTGLAANCALTDLTPRQVTLVLGQVANVGFGVSCTATSGVIEIATATTGIDLDGNGYSVRVDTATAQVIATNGLLRVPATPGAHTVTLSGINGNCAVVGENPRTVTVAGGGLTRDTARSTFALMCSAATAVIEVTTTTGGTALDPNGYLLQLDSAAAQPLGRNGTLRFTGVTGGTHLVRLDDVSRNCDAGTNPRLLAVTVGGATRDTVRTTFAVTCADTSGIARIITTTTGVDIDPTGYHLIVDCEYYYYGPACYTQYYATQMSANDTVVLTNVPFGFHRFQLDDVASNCTVSGGAARDVDIAGGATTDVTFAVSCVAFSRLEITTVTTGTDPDVDGYIALLQGPGEGENLPLAVNGTMLTGPLIPGDYVLQVRGLAINCETVGNDSVAFNVPQGQTLAFSFTIDCRPARTIAFDDGHIQQIKESGANREQLTDGPSDLHPAWSGDGSRVVFSGFRNGNTDLYVFDPTAPGVQARLTTNAQADESPAWSPTSDRIAFVSARAGNPDIWAIDATGANETNLTPYVGGDYDPAWSPDGSKIAFASDRGGIYVMNADGSDTTRITDNANDRAPSWSPDGTKLVFQRVGTCSGYYGTCEHDLYVVHANGTGVTLLFSTYNDEVDPAWSPDGVWIAFTSAPCDYYYGCYYQSTLMAVRSNGTDPRVVAVPSAYRPAWKP